MKLKIRLFFLLASIMLFSATNVLAASFVINDRWDEDGIYWGGQNYDFGGTGYNLPSGEDLVGQPDEFEISQVNVDITNTELEIDVHSVFMNYMATHDTPVEFGDIFLSNDGWNPNTAGVNYQYDVQGFGGEDWEYVLVFDDHSPTTTTGTFNLYEVDESRIIYPEDIAALDPSSVRHGQEVLYDATGQEVLNQGWYRDSNGNWQNGILSGTWEWFNWDTPDASDDFVTLTMNLNFWVRDSNYRWNNVTWGNLGLVDDMGIHMAMTCANDVVEGGDEIPEPATMMLFGTGLAGLAGSAIRRRKKNK